MREQQPTAMILSRSPLVKAFLFVIKTTFSEVIFSLEKVELALLLDDYFVFFSIAFHTKRDKGRC